MNLGTKDYDTTLTRLITILSKLSANELPTLKELADDFNVTIRTIQYDIYSRLKAFPITKDDYKRLKFVDGFSLDKSMLTTDEMIAVSLGISIISDIPTFTKASKTAIQKLLFPKFLNPFSNMDDSLMPSIEVNPEVVKKLQNAIIKMLPCKIYFGSTRKIHYPIRISMCCNDWYLYSTEFLTNKISTCLVSQITDVEIITFNSPTQRNFTELHQITANVHPSMFDSIYSTEAIIEVDDLIENELLKSQVLNKEFLIARKKDGKAIYRYSVINDEDVSSLIKLCMPYIKVLKPETLRQRLSYEIRKFLKYIT